MKIRFRLVKMPGRRRSNLWICSPEVPQSKPFRVRVIVESLFFIHVYFAWQKFKQTFSYLRNFKERRELVIQVGFSEEYLNLFTCKSGSCAYFLRLRLVRYIGL